MSDTPDTDPATAGSADAPGAAPPPPPQPPPDGGRRRLTRRDQGRVIAGVAAGVGDYFDIDPVIVRIAFVVLIFFGGAGVILYALGALLLPGENGEPAPIHDMMVRVGHSGHHRDLGIVLLILAAAFLSDNFHTPDDSVIWGVALIAIGLVLFQLKGGPSRSTAVPAGSAPPPPPAPSAGVGPTTTGGQPTAPAWQSTPSWGYRSDRQQRRAEHRARHHVGPPIGLVTLALAMLALGTALLLSQSGAIPLTVGSALAIVLGVFGAGLAVGSFFRRSWLLIVLGVLLMPLVVAGGLLDEPLSGGVGERLVQPTAPQQVKAEYDLAAGHLALDLTRAHLGAAPTTVRIRVGLGQVDVDVPPDLPVVVHGHAGAGRLDLFGHVSQGARISDDIGDGGTTDENLLTIDVGVGLGNVQVMRAGIPLGVQQ